MGWRDCSTCWLSTPAQRSAPKRPAPCPPTARFGLDGCSATCAARTYCNLDPPEAAGACTICCLDQATTCYQQALNIRRELHGLEETAETLAAIGDTRYAAGYPDEAKNNWCEALVYYGVMEGEYAQARAAQLRAALAAIGSEPWP